MQSRLQKNRSLPYWAAGLSIAAFALFGLVAMMSKTPSLDKRGCSEAIPGKTVFVIDQSEMMALQTKTEIISRIKKLVDEKISIGELVSVFSVTDLSKRDLKPLFSFCKPQQTTKGPSESQRYVTANYAKNFSKTLSAALESPITGSQQSPIAQAIIDLSLSEYIKNPSSSRLIVFSDFLEYTERFKLYGCRDAKTAVADFRTSRGATVARPTFSNTEIQLHIIPRAQISPSVGKCRDGFWAWFFTDNEGKTAGLDQYYLPG